MNLWPAALLCVPIAVGAAIMVAGGASVARYEVHLGVGILGFLSYLGLSAAPRGSATVRVFAAVFCALAIASTLFATGLDGVHRWLELGPVRIHPSALLGPALLILAADPIETRPILTHAVLLGVQGLHVLQPDAGQATALGAAVLFLLASRPTKTNALLALAYAASIVGAWLRPDPLAPAPFVEDIFGRAFRLAPAVGCVAILAMAPAVLSPFLVMRRTNSSPECRTTAGALGVYLLSSVLVILVGEFPVPLLGFSPSPALGAFFGLAALQRFCQRRSPASFETLSGPMDGKERRA